MKLSDALTQASEKYNYHLEPLPPRTRRKILLATEKRVAYTGLTFGNDSTLG